MLASMLAAGMYSRATTSGTAAVNEGAFTAQARPSRNVNASRSPALSTSAMLVTVSTVPTTTAPALVTTSTMRRDTRSASTPLGMVNTRNGRVTADCTSATTSVDSPRCTMTTWAATVSTQIAVCAAS